MVATALAASPALASQPRIDPARTYLAARAAAIGGDHSRSAQLLGQLAETQSADSSIAKKAIAEAVSAGDMRLALRLSRRLSPAELTTEARLLLVADELRSRRPGRAVQYLQGESGEGVNLSFIAPVIAAWDLADRKDPRALSQLDSIPPGNPISGYVPEHRAFILLKLGQTAAAEEHARRAVAAAGAREQRLRFGFAEAFLEAGDRGRAMAMIDGMGTELGRARERIAAGKPSGLAVDTAAEAFSELLLALAIDLNRLRNRTMPLVLSQVARHAAPDNSSGAVLLGVLLESRDRVDDALRVFRSVRADDPLHPQARDAEVRALTDHGRKAEALAVAHRLASSPQADVSDLARLGDAFAALKRFNEAANAYGRALALSVQGRSQERWPLLLLQASALEEAGRWPEARQALTAALQLAPNEPLILNFLGYAKLERGEDLDAAEAMIRKASELDPGNASITDSLGWAIYKRGRLKEAIEILTKAAKGDPTQAEIHEHLGDALYKAGNRYEARYAWEAALLTADDEIAARVRAKIEAGLTAATAAP